MDRRTFFMRGTGGLCTLLGGGLTWHALAQDGNQSRGMITPATQQAIDGALDWLARQQAQDGSFGTNANRGNVAVTALAGLAFMAGGFQPGRGRYGQVVTNAVRNILTHEDRNTPGFLSNQNSGIQGPMYGHGFASLFLAEVYGMVNDRELRTKLHDTLKRSVDLIIKSQNAEGGWRYQPRPQDADISVTICQIMALRAARNAGIGVPKSVADSCTAYVKRCQDVHDSGGFRYQANGGGGPGFARTAAGVVALYSAGIYQGQEVEKGLKFLNNFRPGLGAGNLLQNAEMHMHYHYGHYYAVQAMWIAGGDNWSRWYPAIRDELLANRRGLDHWQGGQDAHYATAMSLIILQVPNNYLPILQR